MNTYRMWATQTLYDSRDIEAESIEAATDIAKTMFVDTGELDPQEIQDGNYGAMKL